LRLAHLLRRGEIERKGDPLVGVTLELGDRGVLQARFDRQQPDRRWLGGVVEELRRTHRRAARGGRQQALPEVREEDGVDEFGLAPRELGHEGHDQLVLVQALEQLLNLEVHLGVRQVLVLQPPVKAGDAGGKPAPPVAVCLETGRKIAGGDHDVPRCRMQVCR
jgi:hypothetical protein